MRKTLVTLAAVLALGCSSMPINAAAAPYRGPSSGGGHGGYGHSSVPITGGAPHISAGSVHISGGAPHISAGSVHISGGAPRFSTPHFSSRVVTPHAGTHVTGTRLTHGGRIGGHEHFRHLGVRHGTSGVGSLAHGVRSHHVGRRGLARGPHPAITGGTARSLARTHAALAAEHGRHFARHDFHHGFFGRHGFRRGFIGWAGPVFWPYAYEDVFGYALFPYDYYDGWYDPFWAYGPDDLFAGIFGGAYGYGYAGEPAAYGRGRRHRTSVATAAPGTPTQGAPPAGELAQLCGADQTSPFQLPFDRIAQEVQPNDAQRAKLDTLKDAELKAAEVLKAACPTSVPATPLARLDTVEKRVDAMLDGVKLVRGPLGDFYASLTDEQKARFNNLGLETSQQQARAKSYLSDIAQLCARSASATAFPAERIEKTIELSPEQRQGLDELRAATAKAADLVKATCPAQPPMTPTARLDAVGKRLDAMDAAIKTVRPALEKFYASLTDEQKARFNSLGQPSEAS